MSGKFIIEDNVLIRYEGNDTVIVVPEGVTRIAYSALGVYDWATPPKITSITLPSTVKEVGGRAFANLKSLVQYTAPSGIVYGDDAFHNCQKLADEAGFIVVDNIAMKYFGDAEVVTIPEGTHTLQKGLFMDRTNLKTVLLPASVKHIGASAFANCNALENIDLPASLITLGEKAFSGCKALADAQGFVIHGNTLYSYYGTDRDVIVPEGVEIIEEDAFSETGIASITLPTTLKTLGAAFKQCKMLSSISIPEGIEALPDYIFSSCIRLAQVTLPSTLKTIGGYAFSGCEDLISVVIPDGVQQIGSFAFEACTSLKSVNLPSGLCLIGAGTFEKCASLERIDLPASVTKIEYSAFSQCTALKEVKASTSTVIDLSDSAFEKCPALVDENGFTIVGSVLIRYTGEGGDVVVPEGVAMISPGTFREGYNYRGLQLRSSGSLRSISLPESLKIIGSSAFAGCSALQSVRIPDSVTTLYSDAFSECYKLAQVDIGKGITELPDHTFHQCSALKKITISERIARIGEDVFEGCHRLNAIDVDEGNPHYASVNGILFNKDKTELILCPGGKMLKEYVIPDYVRKIASKAFIDCETLKKVVIPETVTHIGDTVFYREAMAWKTKYPLTDIEVSPRAGSGHIGAEIFNFPSNDFPLVYPKLPISFVRETSVKTRLAMGYCEHPEKYEGEYAASYKKYVDSHEKAILKKAERLKLADVVAYYAKPAAAEPDKSNVYKPDVSAKRLSARAKVELLEEVVMKGTIDDLKLVLQTYKTFEMTARALALAGRYRGLEFVKTLAEAGATFDYPYSLNKYKSIQNTAAGNYRTEYYLMLVPGKIDRQRDYGYSPLYGVLEMMIPPETEKQALPVEARFETAKYCCENEQMQASMDEMLFWALTNNDLDFADLAIAYGADLNTTPPSYYSYYMQDAPTYLEVITSGTSSIFWNAYVDKMTKLPANAVLPLLERLDKLARAADKKLAVSPKLFDETAWCDDSLVFLLTHADISKITQKKALELAVSKGLIAALDQMAQMGWLSQTAKREKLIGFAQSTNLEAAAWLMDFKNRTVDVRAEAAKEEQKLIRELNEDPNSVTALKRLWSYKKLEDDTLIITGYKGEETDVVVPAMIGKAKVTVIGEEAFSAAPWIRRIKNREARQKIKSITIPEGVVELQSTLIRLHELERVVLPSTLKKVVTPLARECGKLQDINIPASARFTGDMPVLWSCAALQDRDGFAVVNSILYGYQGKHRMFRSYRNASDTGALVIPEGITRIADSVFEGLGIKSVTFPQTLTVIGKNAFEKCSFLECVEIPGTVEKIKSGAFQKCPSLDVIKLGDGVKAIGANAFASPLREVYIPASVKQLSNEIFGAYDDKLSDWENKVAGICVHTQEGAPIVEYAKHYAGIHVVFDYDEAMKG